MREHPNSIEIAGVNFFLLETSPTAFYYYAAKPSLAIDDYGNRQFSWIAAASMLMFTIKWQVPEMVYETLIEITNFTDNAISFSQADLEMENISIELADGQGDYQLLKSEKISSGYLPFNTVFNIKLNHDQAEMVKHLTAQQKPIPLRVSCAAKLQLIKIDEASCSIVGELTHDLAELWKKAAETEIPAAISMLDCRTQIEAALKADRLKKICTATPKASREIQLKAETAALEWAAKALCAMAKDSTDVKNGQVVWELKAEAENIHTERLKENISIPIKCVGDLDPLITA